MEICIVVLETTTKTQKRKQQKDPSMMCFLGQTHDGLEQDGRDGSCCHYTTPQHEDSQFSNYT